MAPRTDIQWTKEQRAGIETVGQNLLVSAAAGSGKTAVLAERCAYLVCDAPEKCDADELLVVTFTKAAAAEMRIRIEAALRKRLDRAEDARLTRELLLLDRAQISTLHAFCTNLLRQHFHVLGLDPNFRVLDEEEIALLRHEIARDLLDERHETDASGEFHHFIDAYVDGNDEAVLHQIVRLHALMCSLVDPDEWLALAAERIAEASVAKPLAKSELGRRLASNVTSWLDDLRRRWIQLAGQIVSVDGLEPYSQYVTELLAAVDHWRKAFGEGNFDALSKEIGSFKSPRLPTIRQPPAQKEMVQAGINSIRDDMQKGPMVEFCRFTEQQWRDGLTSTLPAAKMLAGLVGNFDEAFAQAKRELRGLDFSDLERFALRILRTHSEGRDLTPSAVANGYHEQFKHVLVDEYQDINEVQDAILRLVSRESSGRQAAGGGQHPSSFPPNLFCVGDVKQSIYRFRLAEPRRFMERYKCFKRQDEGTDSESQISNSSLILHSSSFSSGQVIDLSANFRSRAPLLNVINGVFERLMTETAVEIEYDESQRLKAGATFPPDDGTASFKGSPVELHLLPKPLRRGADAENSPEDEQDLERAEREAAFVAKRIAELMGTLSGKPHQVADRAPNGSSNLRPIRYKDIVILLRTMKYKSEDFTNILRAAGIPVHSESGTGFFESMEIRDMLALLRVLDNQQQDIPLAAVLRSPLSGLAEPEDCLARVRLAYSDVTEAPFHRAVVRYADERDDELSAQLRAFLRDLKDWRRLAHQRPLAELLWHIYDCTGYLAFCAGMNDGQQRVANLIDFHERARQFGTFQRQGLGRFMQFLDSLAEQSDLGQPSVASEADDVVKVMSIHRSKGLEFPVVVVPDLGKAHNLQDTHGSILVDRDSGIGLMVADEPKRVRYPSLAHVLVQDRIKRQTLAEELRVLYVAMTRAKEHLILVGTCEPEAPDGWKEQWSHHTGPLPAERILSGRTMLDWIGPAAAAINGSGTKDRIEMTWHDDKEIAEWSTTAQRRAGLSEVQQRLAKLEPLTPPPPMHPDAQRVTRQLTTAYPHKDFVPVPAVQSVGSLTKEGRGAPGGQSPSRESVVSFDIELPAPRCVLESLSPAPTVVGSAVHLVLEHVDFSRPCDRADLRDQVAGMLHRKLIAPLLGEAVDLDSIVWLVSTPIGKLLRRNNAALRRELAIYFPQTPDDVPQSSDPLDRIMVRGRVDVLIPDADGIVIVDYKTDRVTEQTVDARADFYRQQLGSYRDAIEAITGQPVKSAKLVFLTPRVIKDVKAPDGKTKE